MQIIRRTASFAFVCLFALGSFQARSQTQPSMTLRVAEPEVQPVRLARSDVVVNVAGSEAWIRYDLEFHNPNARLLEGTLEFPLAEGQQVVGFALDVDGELRDAVAVPKAKARAVFESIERQNVDPGLLEQTAGNHYRLRIYPLPAGGTRKVRLWIAQSLERAGGMRRLSLPLAFATTGGAVPVTLTGTPRALAQGLGRRLSYDAAHGRTWTTLSTRDLDREGRVVFEWPATEATSVSVQRSAQGEFALAETVLANARAVPAPMRHLVLIWDASLSREGRDHALELAALDRLLKKAGDLRVTLQVLRDAAEPPRVFDVRNGDGQALLAAIGSLVYDGATRASAMRPVAGADRYLYVGDGLFNGGVDAVPTLPARLDAWVNGDADVARLASMAARQFGQVYRLGRSEDLPAIDGMFQAPARIERIELTGAREARLRSPFPDAEGRVRFAALRDTRDARATLHWRDATGAHATEVDLSGEAVEGRMAGFAWARWSLDALEADRALHRKTIEQLGARFGIVNAESSLIVLESVDDYVRHDIAPPASLQAAWEAALAVGRQRTAEKRASQVEGLVLRYAEREAWWNRAFPKNAPPKSPASVTAGVDAMAPAPSEPVPLMSPSAPEPPVVAEARAEAAADRASAEASARRAPPTAARPEGKLVSTIRIQPWQSDSPEAKQLRDTPTASLYRAYLGLRTARRDSPAFYLDAADVLRERGEIDLARRVLSNLDELGIEDRHLLRLLAYRLEELKAWKDAVPLLRQVLLLAPEEPQSHRDLALALQATGDYPSAAEAFYTVATGSWDPRFADIDLIALVELNALIAKHRSAIDTRAFDARLLKHFPVGMRTVLSWDADNSDMDLWVTDPDGEKVFYGHKLSHQGGRISRDFTGGYGPEEFVLRAPKKGTYTVQANYFGSRHQVLSGETTLMLTFSTAYGTPAQKDQTVTLRLKDAKDTVMVGQFVVK